MRNLVTSDEFDRMSVEDLQTKLETMMDNRCSNWPDPQIIKQSGWELESICIFLRKCYFSEETNGKPGPFATVGENLSCVSVDIPEYNYKTRTTTIVVVDRNNKVWFMEQNHNCEAKRTNIDFNCDI